MAKRRIMRRFRLREISAVDRPAQEHAKVTIFKREDDMPWSASDAMGHTKKADTPAKQKKWATIANAALDDGHDEGSAVRIANAAISKGIDVTSKEGRAILLDMAPDDETEPYWKREFSEEQRDKDAKSGAAESDGSYPIHNAKDLHNAMQAIGRSKNPAKTKAHIRRRAKALGLTSELSDAFKRDDVVTKLLDAFWGSRIEKARAALVKSMQSIVEDDDADKDELIGQSADDFVAHFADLSEDLTKAVTGGDPADLMEDDMSPELKKALGLPADATAEQVTAAVVKLTGAADKAKDDEIAKLRKEAADAQAALALAKAGFSAEELAFYNNLPDQAAKDAFLKADKEGRMVQMQKREPELLELAKAVAAKEALEKRVKSLEEAADLEKYKKEAIEIGLPETKAATLMKLAKTDKAAYEEMKGITKSAIAAAKEGGLFKEFGATGRTEAMTAYEELEVKAKELQKADPKLSFQQAFAKVYATDTALAKKERQENRPAGVAA